MPKNLIKRPISFIRNGKREKSILYLDKTLFGDWQLYAVLPEPPVLVGEDVTFKTHVFATFQQEPAPRQVNSVIRKKGILPA